MKSPLSNDALNRVLREALPTAQRYWVAYSGGCDSHVLLHLMAAMRAAGPVYELAAVHVDHGLSPHAQRWVRHCEEVCRALGVRYHPVSITLDLHLGEGVEGAARTARYAAIRALLRPGDCVLTAHHREDQAETLLLQLLRGAGPAGLASMPGVARLGAGTLARPLLQIARSDLLAYAVRHGLEWIDDESNFDTRLDRNFIRHEVMPAVKRRWPGADASLSRAAAHCAEAAAVLDALARVDLDASIGAGEETLDVVGLVALPEPRMRNLLRYWIRSRGLPLPDAAKLARVRDEVLCAGPDRNPCLAWPGGALRRYRGRLYLTAPPAPQEVARMLDWAPEQPLSLPGGTGTMRAVCAVGAGVKTTVCHEGLTIRFRRGGERCRPAGAAHTRSLKHLFQERGIPPWQRANVPLVYVGDELAAVGDLWLCEPFCAGANETGWVLHWDRPGDPGDARA